MDSTPPSHRSEPRSRTKLASRLARIGDLSLESEDIPHLSIGLVSPSDKKTPSTSTLSLKSSTSLPLQELLLLSPSPLRRSKTRLTDRVEMPEELNMEHSGSRRRCKTRAAQVGLLGCASPRGVRRSRRSRTEIDIREEKDLFLGEEIGKPRRRRHHGRSNKEKLSLVPSISVPSSLSPKSDDDDLGSLDRIGQLITDLIMWKDVAKSSLWFGFGFLGFFSSCFAKGVSLSIFSTISQIGLVCLGASFILNSICRRNNTEKKNIFKFKEDDILRVAKVILPAANLAISKTRDLFSGEPSMTLKVAPFLLLGSEYGRLITLWRLCAIGFFSSFTIPKLYSCYSDQINQKVDCLKCWLSETWGACSHKKIVMASAATAFWNLSTVKTRIFTVFLSLVILQYFRQHIMPKSEGRLAREDKKRQELDLTEAKQALVVVN